MPVHRRHLLPPAMKETEPMSVTAYPSRFQTRECIDHLKGHFSTLSWPSAITKLNLTLNGRD